MISALDTLDPPYAKSTQKKKRVFAPLYMSSTEALKRPSERGLIKLVDPITEPKGDQPAWWDANSYCNFHQGKGNDTEKCL
ncbi:hypothetical protein vseg_013324 [Gypsophila vaccaria]